MFLAFPFFRLCWLSGLIFGGSWLPLGTLFTAFWLQVGVLGRLLPPKSASWGGFRPPSWHPGGLGASKLASLAAWASKLASWTSLGPPSWTPEPALGLQVGLLVWLWAIKL